MIIAGNGGQQLPVRLRDKTSMDAAGDGERDSALDALDAMKQAKADMRSQRKKAAADKVQRLKQELQNLKAFGGDPGKVARQAARIARNLSGAMQDYRGVHPDAAAAAPAGQDRIEAEARQIHRRLKTVAEEQRRRADEEIGDKGEHDGELAAMDLAVLRAGNVVMLDIQI